jgi:hypothetical protein
MKYLFILLFLVACGDYGNGPVDDTNIPAETEENPITDADEPAVPAASPEPTPTAWMCKRGHAPVKCKHHHKVFCKKEEHE